MSYNKKHNSINTISIHDISAIDLEIPHTFGGHITTSYDVEQVVSHCGVLKKIASKYSFTMQDLFTYGFEQLSEIYSEKHQEMIDDSSNESHDTFNNEEVWYQMNKEFEFYEHALNFNKFIGYMKYKNLGDFEISSESDVCNDFTRKQAYKQFERASLIKNKSCKSFLHKCKNGFSVKKNHPKETLSSEMEDTLETDTQVDRLNKTDLKDKIRRSGFNSSRSRMISRKTMEIKRKHVKPAFDDDFALYL